MRVALCEIKCAECRRIIKIGQEWYWKAIGHTFRRVCGQCSEENK